VGGRERHLRAGAGGLDRRVLLEPPAPAPDEPPYPEDDPGDTDRPAPPSNFVVPSPPPSTYSPDTPVENAEPTPSVPWLEGVAP
jgi:hypothetical protein